LNDREAERGYRLLPHTADVIVSAWAPTAEGCIAEAVRGLVASFLDVTGATPGWPQRLSFDPAPDTETLVLVLEEVIYLLDTRQVVPVRVEVSRTDAGDLQGRWWLVPAGSGRPVGSAPKAVTRHGLEFGHDSGRWRCTVTIDV
jgi:SHS2 domain-containing protein